MMDEVLPGGTAGSRQDLGRGRDVTADNLSLVCSARCPESLGEQQGLFQASLRRGLSLRSLHL